MPATDNPGSLIRDARKAHGWNQTALGDRLGVTQGRVSEIETWTKPPSLAWFLEHADVWRSLGIWPSVLTIFAEHCPVCGHDLD